MGLSKTVLAQGKRLLMEAAVNLTATTRSLNALSLRELAREAGLNPNTFYRHFKNIDDIGLAIVEDMAKQIRQPLRDLRRQAADSVTPPGAELESWDDNPALNLMRSVQVDKETVKLFFDFVEENPNAFILGVRELHGASPLLRKALRKVMRDFSLDMAEDIKTLGLLPKMDSETLFDLAETISREMFQLSMDYIERPESRGEILEKTQKMIISLSVGYAVTNGYGSLIANVIREEGITV